MRVFITILVVACLITPAWGETPAQHQRADLFDARQWGAVGRLDILDGGFCTATLIDKTHILTAGHCVFNAETGELADPDNMEFHANWRDGQANIYRRIRRVVVHPDYAFSGDPGLGRVGFDIAVLELRGPIYGGQIQPLALSDGPTQGAEIGIVSYAHTGGEAPSLQRGCNVLNQQNGAYVMSCQVDYGSSGAPVFRFDTSPPQIISVVSAMATLGDTPVSLGASIDAQTAFVRGALGE